MTDSMDPDELDRKHVRDRERRLDAIERWVQYIKTHDPSIWGPQLNRLVDSKLESARQSEVDIETRRRVDEVGRDG